MKVTSYTLFDSIADEPLLTREEEVELSKKIELGDKNARDRMIKANLRLALSVVKKYINRGVDADDLLQESIVGLAKAVDQFDWSRGFKFSTYAYWWIQQAVRQCVASNTGPIALPSNAFSKLYTVSRFEKEYKQRFGHGPTDEETAQMFGTTADTLKALRQSASHPVSIDKPIYRDDTGNRTLADILPSNDKPVDEKIDDDRLANTIRESLSMLTEREKLIIMMRFGIDDFFEESNNDNA
jgi:RNA polymerase primary sigma factor